MSTRRRHHHLTRRQKITLKMKRKLALLFVVIVLILVGIIVRLVYINRVSGEQYTKKVLAQQDTTVRHFPTNEEIFMTGTALCLPPVRKYTT